ncbi:ABC transporter substrate-binding protein [Janibacter sp. DB-40]|uniref:ABC transporter substrate-binding protein n=1 Tax=Janibacter sp. DB-40 TaxID=3028808 RepID=UPI0024061EEC|nr:ABC transporter substrate-binding protein [Janibacter sp. DB-40]
MTRRRTVRTTAALALVAAVLAGCGTGGSGGTGHGAGSAAAEPGGATVTNCDREVALPSPAERMYVTGDGNLLSLVLALGAEEQVAGVTGLDDGREALSTVYGQDVVEGLPVASPDRPTLENAIAHEPDVVVSGWSYGFSDEQNFTPGGLAEHGIGAYVLSESCRQEGGARGTMPPWEALYADLANLGRITGHPGRADAVVEDIEERRRALEQAPQAQEPPTVFLFDSGTKEIFTSGSYGGPQAIIETAGARNATGDVADTWTEVSWERLVTSQPDAIAFVDYPGQTFEQKVEVLETNPATKDLPAVEEERYVNLPIAAWTSGPLNIDAAEQLRVTLERHGLVPESAIEPRHDLRP